MSTRRQALLVLAGLVVPGAPSAATPPKPKPAAKAAEAAAGQKPGKPPVAKPRTTPAKPAPQAIRPARARPAPAVTPEGSMEPGPPPRRPAIRAADDGPTLRPLDRDLVRNWLAANPDWRPPGAALPLAIGKPLPPGAPRQPLPPGLAVLLPYFPGYRYAAAGPDLVLYAAATGLVASLLPGALAR